VTEAEAINALREAKLRFDRSGDKRHLREAISEARAVPMTDAAIAAELGAFGS
jgi:hypothetical protein